MTTCPDPAARLACRVVMTTLIGVAGACGDGGTGPGGDDDPAQRLAIIPEALLLSAPGQTASLRVVGIDADGDTVSVAGTVRWHSTHGNVLAVDASGQATAGALGSSLVSATVDGATTEPVLALVARPAAGALLVSDAQVDGVISPVDPAAPYQPGWQYRVRLRGVAPSMGQVILGSGGKPVAGRVTSIGSSAGGSTEVVLALTPLGELFEQLDVNESIPLADGEPEASPVGLRRGARAPAGRAEDARLSRVETEFSLGRFKCKAELPPALQFPVSLEAFNLDVDPSLTLDMVIAGSALQRFVVHGGVSARLEANPMLTAGIEAKAECLLTHRILTIPIGGPLALLFGGQVPLGVGFEIGAKATFGQLGVDAFYEASLTTQFGIDCTAACEVVADMTTSPPEGFFKPRIPSFEDDLRFELAGSAFGFAKLAIGNRFLEELRFEAVELKAGLEQKFELAGRNAQASDAAYASAFSLKPVLEFKTGSKLQALAGLLGITLAELIFSPELPILAQSPRGTFQITPERVAAGDGSSLGERATFSIALDPVSYLGAYAVDKVEIRWLRSSGAGTTLQPGRPGCTDLSAAAGQVTFSCQTDFLEEDTGPQTFYAFVHTKIFGVPVPVPLEVAADGRATVQVGPVPQGVAGTWTGTFNGTFTPNDGSEPRESPGTITLVLGQSGTSVSGTAELVTFFGPATGRASGTLIGSEITNFTMTATSQTTPPCSGSFTGTASVNLVAGTMIASYAGADCRGTITDAVATLTRTGP